MNVISLFNIGHGEATIVQFVSDGREFGSWWLSSDEYHSDKDWGNYIGYFAERGMETPEFPPVRHINIPSNAKKIAEIAMNDQMLYVNVVRGGTGNDFIKKVLSKLCLDSMTHRWWENV